jgi:hypothetical protein
MGIILHNNVGKILLCGWLGMGIIIHNNVGEILLCGWSGGRTFIVSPLIFWKGKETR